VVSVRFVTAEVTQGAAEILAYGTAVRLAGGSEDDAEQMAEAIDDGETTSDADAPTE
jgi:hypothetical protein